MPKQQVQIDKDRVIELYEGQTLTIKQAAAVLGVTHSRLHNFMIKHGIESRSTGCYEYISKRYYAARTDEPEMVHDYAVMRMTLVQVGRKHKVSQRCLREILARNKCQVRPPHKLGRRPLVTSGCESVGRDVPAHEGCSLVA